jgi:hypothetical protein
MSRATPRVSRPLAAVNVMLAVIALFCVISMMTPLTTPLLMPAATTPRDALLRTAVRESTQSDYSPRELQTASSQIIVARNLFSPTRTELSQETASSSPTPIIPSARLHGVVVDGQASIAYLEDLTTKRTAGYRLGDKIAGGTVETIDPSAVVVRGSNGPIRISLRDPSRPRRSASPTSSMIDRVLPAEPPAFRGVLPPDADIAKPLRPPPQ